MKKTKKQQTLSIPAEGESAVNLFRKKEIRKVLHKKEWWFCVKDILEALTDVPDGTKYLAYLRGQDASLNKRYSEIRRTLVFQSKGGMQKTNFVNIEGIFRLVQSIPTKRAEPFKRWLARVGFERLQEIHNPELAVKRAIILYRAKGYDDQWIEARIRSKASRELLTGEWHRRGMTTYIALLTDTISVGTFNIKTRGHKELKGLKGHQSLRDNMSPIELTLTTLGEQATQEIAQATNPIGLRNNIDVASQGGRIAGGARRKIESATGRKVLSPKNYLTTRQKKLNAEKNKEFNKIMEKLLPPGKSQGIV